MEPSTPSSIHPVVRLNPKAESRAIRHGFPWVYANELITDRRTRQLAAGTIAVLQDNGREPVGLVGVNPASKIICRLLDRDIDAQIDAAWFAARFAHALSHREKLYDAPFYRLVHAEADGLPGVIVDRFGELVVLQPNAAWADALLEPMIDGLLQATGVKDVVVNGTGRARVLEGLDETTTVVRGNAPMGPIHVPMSGATYMADVVAGQKTGLFYDQRPNHRFAASLSQGARVLDVFSHVGGFGLAALAKGAASVLAIDGSAAALELARKGAATMKMSDRFGTRKGDAFDALNALAEEGEIFDVVICDPPAFAPSRTALEQGLRAYEKVARLAAPLVSNGGYLVLCSCSHAAELAKFRNACTRGIGRAGRSGQIIHTGFAGPDHPLMPQLAESGYLKALFYRL